MELEGKRLLLSGATGGLGRAIAIELAGRGATLVLSSRREKELADLARVLPGGAGRHAVVVADLAREGAAAELARALRVNLESPILMARALAPSLERTGEGHLVFISSLAGKVASPRASLYSATKFGLRGFAFGLREDLHPSGVGVSVVSPGFVREAGMFHDAETKPPPGLGTTTPTKVARAVAKAILRDRSEIVVAPRRQRALARLGHARPELAARVQRRGGADRIADDLAAGQADKR